MISDPITIQSFSEDNRSRTIKNSMYRICRTETGVWYINEVYNNPATGSFAIGSDFHCRSLRRAINQINRFTKEKEIISRKIG